MALLRHQEANANCRLLLRENWSGWSRVNQKKQLEQVCDGLEAAGRQVSVFTVECVLQQHELRGCLARKKLHLKGPD